jgi:phosphotransferase system enzyme I (PtsI)
MVEIPAAAAMADQLAAEADFFSVGTNDLVQYAMAADRMNAKLAYLNQALHPAILRLLGGVVEAAHARGRRAAVCGEMAADPEAQVLLVGMGYDELSMSAASIPASRAAIAGIDSRAARGLYLRARDLESAEEVRAFVRKNEDKERGGPRK